MQQAFWTLYSEFIQTFFYFQHHYKMADNTVFSEGVDNMSIAGE